MDTCGTCKYFGEEFKKYDNETFEEIGTGYHRCDLIKHHKSNSMSFNYDPDDIEPPFVIDGSGYFAALVINEDFGCIKWEAK